MNWTVLVICIWGFVVVLMILVMARIQSNRHEDLKDRFTSCRIHYKQIYEEIRRLKNNLGLVGQMDDGVSLDGINGMLYSNLYALEERLNELRDFTDDPTMKKKLDGISNWVARIVVGRGGKLDKAPDEKEKSDVQETD